MYVHVYTHAYLHIYIHITKNIYVYKYILYRHVHIFIYIYRYESDKRVRTSFQDCHCYVGAVFKEPKPPQHVVELYYSGKVGTRRRPNVILPVKASSSGYGFKTVLLTCAQDAIQSKSTKTQNPPPPSHHTHFIS